MQSISGLLTRIIMHEGWIPAIESIGIFRIVLKSSRRY